VAFDLHNLPSGAVSMLEERHLATLTVMRADGRPHVSPVGFTYDNETRTARVITSAAARKAVLIGSNPRVALCQVDGGVWLTLEGNATVTQEPTAVADAEARYTARYQAPRVNPNRVAVMISVDRMYGRVRSE
jgi:F420H(2)-dependent biliverdin reductase